MVAAVFGMHLKLFLLVTPQIPPISSFYSNVCVMAAVRDFPRAQCMRTWLSSGSDESGIAERGAETPGGDDVT